MRIYIMEEHRDMFHGIENVDELYKMNADLKAEIETVKAELADKEDLILQAAKAMEALESRHHEEIKKNVEKCEKDKAILEDAYLKLQQELSDRKELLLEDTITPPTPNKFENSLEMYAMAFSLPYNKFHSGNEKVQQNKMLTKEMEEKIKELLDACGEKEAELKTTRATNEELEELVKQLTEDLKETTKKRLAAEDTLVLRTEEKNRLEDMVEQLKLSSEKMIPVKFDEKQNGELLRRLKFLEGELEIKSQAFEKLKNEHIKALKTTKGLIKQNKALMREVNLLKVAEGEGSSKVPLMSNHAFSDGLTDCPGEEILLEEAKTKTLVEIPTSNRQEGSQGFAMFMRECERKMLNSDGLDDILGVKKQQEGDKEKMCLQWELESRDKKIDLLNEELRKRTFNLQELVNTELWDKNREIEKLNKAFEKKQAEITSFKTMMSSKDAEMKSLLDQVEFLNQRIQTLQEAAKDFETKITQDFHGQIGDLKKKLDEMTKNRNRVLLESNKWKKEMEDSEKARKELINACTLLTKRLEELVTFLECLAPSPETKEGRMIQEAIIRSREVSRSFSFSFRDLSVPILPDFSQVDFCSETDSLEMYEPLSKVSNDEVVSLRTQVESLVDNLRNKDDVNEGRKMKPWVFECGLPSKEDGDVTQLEDVTEGSPFESIEESCTVDLTKTHLNRLQGKAGEVVAGSLSESDGWSEPDRNVSMARIGIKEETPSPSAKQVSTDSHCQPILVNPPSTIQDALSYNSFIGTPSPLDQSFFGFSTSKRNRRNYIEIRSLNMKIKSLEHTNESLENELKVLKGKALLTTADKEILCRIDEGSSKVIEELNGVKVQLERSCQLCLELQRGNNLLESENKEVRDRLVRAEVEISDLQAAIKEKENQLLEKQCSLLEAKNRELVLSEKLAELKHLLEKLSQLNKELEDTKTNWKRAEEKVKELLVEIQAIKSKHDKDMLALLNEKNSEKEELIKEHHVELRSVEKKLEELSQLKEAFESEWKIKFDSLEKEKNRELEAEIKRRIELEKNLSLAYDFELQLKNRIDAEIAKARDTEITYKLDQRRWTRKVADLEESIVQREKEWRRKLDNAIVDHSRIVLERARMTNDKLCHKSELCRRDGLPNNLKVDYERSLARQEEANMELEMHLVGSYPSLPSSPRNKMNYPNSLMLTRQSSNPSSDYMSDPEPLQSSNGLVLSCHQRNNNNCSPDLGIESDQGRPDGPQKSISATDISFSASLRAENDHLKKQLVVVNEALQNTLSQLSTANYRKRQVEKAICQQLSKTHKILQKARVNIDHKDDTQKHPL